MDGLKEEWKELKDNPLYMVSNTGLIVSFLRKNSKILKHTIAKGYPTVGLQLGGRLNSQRSVAKIVADTFLPNPNNRKTVLHKDGDKLNCRITNLVWADKNTIALYEKEGRKQQFMKELAKGQQLNLFE